MKATLLGVIPQKIQKTSCILKEPVTTVAAHSRLHLDDQY